MIITLSGIQLPSLFSICVDANRYFFALYSFGEVIIRKIERRASQSTEPATKYRLQLQAKYLLSVKIRLSRFSVITARRQLSRLRRRLLNARNKRNSNDILTLSGIQLSYLFLSALIYVAIFYFLF